MEKVVWEAPAHRHTHKTFDWYFALWIIALALAATAYIFKDPLLTILILLGAAVTTLFSVKPPEVITFEVTRLGVRMGDEMFTYDSFASFWFEERNAQEDTLLISKNKNSINPRLSIDVPKEHRDAVHALIAEHVLEVPDATPRIERWFEYLGF